MSSFASLDDLRVLWRVLTTEEEERAKALLIIVSDNLREEAVRVGVDIDKKAEDSKSYANVLKSVVVDIVARTLMTATSGEPMVQESQSALGYSWSGTYLVPGGGLFIKDSELKKLGLKKQRYGVVNFYENTWNDDHAI